MNSLLETIAENFEELEDFLKFRWVSGLEFPLPIKSGIIGDTEHYKVVRINSETHGEIIYWSNGNKYRESYLRGHEPDEIPLCIQKFWYENGRMRLREHFKNGKLDGWVTVWADDGQKIQEVAYTAGILVYDKHLR